MKNFDVLRASCFAVAVMAVGMAYPHVGHAADAIPPVSEKELKLEPEAEAPPAPPVTTVAPSEADASRPLLKLAPVVVSDAVETDAIKITPDKPEIVTLDRDAVNVLVGSNETLRVVPDTNRSLVLIPKKPGSTYFKALDVDGKVIMQRHIIVGVAKKDYVRIRRTCASGDTNCHEFSVYYCPDMCHEVSVAQNGSGESPAVPVDTVASSRPVADETNADANDGVEPVVNETGTSTSPAPADAQ